MAVMGVVAQTDVSGTTQGIGKAAAAGFAKMDIMQAIAESPDVAAIFVDATTEIMLTHDVGSSDEQMQTPIKYIQPVEL